ncbi:DsbA family protein [Gordonia sp. PKS22-38]|uniref:DsbA family protein n=1 Tax=Gordonia prachuapensis TaxID=3115651 RepID=A0ABU7MNU5_9ACTN|nr:DsbA family protein [Gordonia sp. PKS22-38]
MSTPHIDVYADPICPFTWVTSRWLAGVSERGDARVTWRLMSLAVLNEGQDADGAQAEKLELSRRVGRLVAAATGTDDMGGLYMALGRRLHVEGLDLTDDVARAALTECGLDPTLTPALDDPRWDGAVRGSHRQSQDTLGDSGGSPITAIDGQAFFGPVLTDIPGTDEAIRLFKAVTTLATSPAFAQVERPRWGPPNTQEPAV